MIKLNLSQSNFKISKIVPSLFFAFALTLIACKKKENTAVKNKPIPTTNSTSTVSLKIANEPFLTDYLTDAILRFNKKDFRLTGNRKISFELVPISGNAAYDQIASGKLKVDAWISSPYYLQLANKQRRNLGPAQSNCRTLFHSPMVLALPLKFKGLMSNIPDEMSFSNIVEELSNELKVGISHRIASSSFGGTETILQLASAASDTLTIDDPAFEKEFSSLLKKVNYFGEENETVLNKARLQSPKRVAIGIVSEFEAIQYNKKTRDPEKHVELVYPSEGSHIVSSTMCQSEVEWVTRDKKTALSIFSQFLQSSQEKSIARENGFRTPRNSALREVSEVNKINEVGSLDKSLKKYGAAPDQPKEILNYPELEKIESILSLWTKHAKPQKVSILFDVSGSMQGESIAFAQAFVHNIVSALRENSLVELITFSGTAETLVPLTKDTRKISEKIKTITPAGGSASLDALKIALENIVQDQNEDYVRSILLITDGPDISSRTPLIVASNMLNNVLAGEDFNFFFIDIINKDFSNANIKKELTRTDNAIYFEAEPRNILDLLPQIIRNM